MKEWREKSKLVGNSKSRAPGEGKENPGEELFAEFSHCRSSHKRNRMESPLDITELQRNPKHADIRVGQAPDIFHVDRIVDEKLETGLKLYRVRWIGYAASEDTWEPSSNISARVPTLPRL